MRAFRREIKMNVSELEQRVVDLAKAIEQSVAQHNGLVGRYEEAKFVLDQMKKAVEVVEEVAQEL